MRKQMLCVILVFLFSFVAFAGEGDQTTGNRTCLPGQVCIPSFPDPNPNCIPQENCSQTLSLESNLTPKDFFNVVIKDYLYDLMG